MSRNTLTLRSLAAVPLALRPATLGHRTGPAPSTQDGSR
jgi:hypothetical protein